MNLGANLTFKKSKKIITRNFHENKIQVLTNLNHMLNLAKQEDFGNKKNMG